MIRFGSRRTASRYAFRAARRLSAIAAAAIWVAFSAHQIRLSIHLVAHEHLEQASGFSFPREHAHGGVRHFHSAGDGDAARFAGAAGYADWGEVLGDWAGLAGLPDGPIPAPGSDSRPEDSGGGHSPHAASDHTVFLAAFDAPAPAPRAVPPATVEGKTDFSHRPCRKRTPERANPGRAPPRRGTHSKPSDTTV